MHPFSHGVPVQGLPLNHSAAAGAYVGPQAPLPQQQHAHQRSYYYQDPSTYQHVSRKGFPAPPAPYASEEAVYTSKRPGGFPVPVPGPTGIPAVHSATYQQQRSHTPNSARYMDARPGSAETISSDPLPMTPPRPVFAHPAAVVPERHSARVARVDTSRSSGSDTPAAPAQDPVNVHASKPARINPDTSAQYVMSTTGQEICFVATAVNADRAPVVPLKTGGSPASTPTAGKYGRSGSDSSSISSGSEPRTDASFGGVLGLGLAGDQMALHARTSIPHAGSSNNVMSMDQLAQMMHDVASLLQSEGGDSSLGLGRPPRAELVPQRGATGLARAGGSGSQRHLRY